MKPNNPPRPNRRIDPIIACGFTPDSVGSPKGNRVALADRIAKDYGLGFSGDGADLSYDIATTQIWKTWEGALGRIISPEDFEAALATWIP